MILEFAGIPGSGKSTHAARLIDVLCAGGYPARSGTAASYGDRPGGQVRRIVRAYRKGTQLWTYRGLWVVSLSALAASNRPVRDRILTLRRLAKDLDGHRDAAARPEISVFDEGIVQRAFSLFVDGSAAPERLVRSFVSTAPAPDLLILMSVEPAAAVLRLRGRERGLSPRISRLKPSHQLTALHDADELLLTVARGLRGREPSMGLFRVDSAASEAAVDAEILAAVSLAAKGLS